MKMMTQVGLRSSCFMLAVAVPVGVRANFKAHGHSGRSLQLCQYTASCAPFVLGGNHLHLLSRIAGLVAAHRHLCLFVGLLQQLGIERCQTHFGEVGRDHPFCALASATASCSVSCLAGQRGRSHAWCRRSSLNSWQHPPTQQEQMWRQATEKMSKFAEPSASTESTTMSAKRLPVRAS